MILALFFILLLMFLISMMSVYLLLDYGMLGSKEQNKGMVFCLKSFVFRLITLCLNSPLSKFCPLILSSSLPILINLPLLFLCGSL